ncbi:MAG TPA: GAF domain-containing sensor histidine kinase [Pseudonocardia sp.]|nr:GAF domain-containing sensor histidine kinase [Pseudonocardia sp.]
MTDGWAELVAAALDGLALLDAEGRYRHVNPAGCRILGVDAAELLGEPAVFDPAGDALIRWCPPGTTRARDLEYRSTPVGPHGTAVTFRDVTEERLARRRLAAFTAAAANVADAGTLRATLDAICAEMVHTTDLAAAQILLIDGPGARMRVTGAAPAGAGLEDFVIGLEEARRRGAELMTLHAMRTRRPVIRPQRKAEMLADPAWAPLHEQFRRFEWNTYVSVPLLVRETAVGALNAYYRPGHDPDDEDVRFLSSMADHAAVAVQNAQLLADSRDKAALDERHRLARELHDSACQQLFSMTLHIRAAELTLAAGTADRAADEVTRQSLRTLDGLAHAALDDLRALVFELYPALLQSEGLVAVLRRTAADTAARVGLDVSVHAPDGRLALAPEVELDAHRLVQEALHNCVKHAAANSVRVAVGPDPDTPGALLLEVADDGRGFDPAATRSGLGLISMAERAERLGGELCISSREGAGTLVRAVVPRVLGAS